MIAIHRVGVASVVKTLGQGSSVMSGPVGRCRSGVWYGGSGVSKTDQLDEARSLRNT